MKAALNGGLNCSILDGWWDEWFDGDERLGDLVGRGRARPRPPRRARGGAACSTCSSTRSCRCSTTAREGPVPRRWVRRVKHVLALARPEGDGQPHGARLRRPSCTSRPPAQADPLAADGYAPARELAAWKRTGLGPAGTTVEIASVDSDTGSAELGADRRVVAEVDLGALDARRRRGAAAARPGRRRATSSIEPTVEPLTFAGPDGARPGPLRGQLPLRAAPAATASRSRVVPRQPGLTGPVELGRIAWA